MIYTEAGQFEQAESILLWLIHAAEQEIKIYEANNEWKEAGETYLLLFRAYYRVENEDYLTMLRRLWACFAKGSCVTRGRRYSTKSTTTPEDCVWQPLGTERYGDEISGESWATEQNTAIWRSEVMNPADSGAYRVSFKG